MSNFNKFMAILMVLVIVLLTVNASMEYKRITNLRVKGWLFGDKDKWIGWRTPSAATANDTFYVAGADTGDYMFVTARTDSVAYPLTARVWKKDSVLIATKNITTNTDKINWMIIKR